MEALLTFIVIWLSSNSNLPSAFEHPRIEFVSATQMKSHFYEGVARQKQAGLVLNQSEPEVISLYSNETKTIYLLNGWEGKTPVSCRCWSTKWFLSLIHISEPTRP